MALYVGKTLIISVTHGTGTHIYREKAVVIVVATLLMWHTGVSKKL